MIIYLFLVALINPIITCGCENTNDIKTLWGHDNIVVMKSISCDIINGEVRNWNKEILSGVLVEVFKLDMTQCKREWNYPTERVVACVTSENGRFCFDNLPPGVYEVRFSKEEYETLSYACVRVKEGKSRKKKEADLRPSLKIQW